MRVFRGTFPTLLSYTVYRREKRENWTIVVAGYRKSPPTRIDQNRNISRLPNFLPTLPAGMMEGFVKLDTLQSGRTHCLPSIAFIPSSVTQLHISAALLDTQNPKASRLQQRNEWEGEGGRNHMGPQRIGLCSWESEATERTTATDATEANDTTARGTIIALAPRHLVNISCGICGFAERSRFIEQARRRYLRAVKYHKENLPNTAHMHPAHYYDSLERLQTLLTLSIDKWDLNTHVDSNLSSKRAWPG